MNLIIAILGIAVLMGLCGAWAKARRQRHLAEMDAIFQSAYAAGSAEWEVYIAAAEACLAGVDRTEEAPKP